MAQYPTSIGLSTLDGTTGYTFRSGVSADWFGFSISSAGDIDGDGTDDLLIGDPGRNIIAGRPATPTLAGQTFLLFGDGANLAALDGLDGVVDGDVDLSLMTAANGYRLTSGIVGDASGSAVSSVGDVDGVAGADLLIGAPGTANGTATLVSGSTLAAFDAADGSTDGAVDLGLVSGALGYSFTGRGAGHQAGFSVGGGDDYDGDGVDDLIIGANRANPNGTTSGEAALVFGGAANLAALDAADGAVDNQVLLANLDGATGYIFEGVDAGDQTGFDVSRLGDLNGDGVSDLLVSGFHAGAGAAGETYLLFGGSANFAAMDVADGGAADGRIALSAIDGTNGYRFVSPSAGEFGSSISSAGDVNGDGVDDILIGDPFSDPAGQQSNSGEAYIVFGGAARLAGLDAADGSVDGTLNPGLLDGTNGFRISGTAREWAGFSVAGAGDVDGDGFDDVLIGANFNSTRTGVVYVLFGGGGLAAADAVDGANGQIITTNIAGVGGFRIDGIDTEDMAGIRVAGIGDINGDALADIMVTQIRDGTGSVTPTNQGDGEVYVVYSRVPDAAVNRTGSAASQTIVGSAFADTLSGAGGNDELIGGDGGDALNGGSGADTASYRTATARVTADLAQAGANTGDAAGDGYASVENLAGTRFGDLLRGNDAGNRLEGLAGNDTLVGSDGNDVLIGGDGRDKLNGGAGSDVMHGGDGDDTYFVDRPGDSVVETGNGTDIVMSSISFALAGPNLAAIERLTLTGAADTDGTGNSSNNVIVGNSGANKLNGAGGNDSANGGAGNDRIAGGVGNDKLVGGTGLDVLTGGAGADMLTGGLHADIFKFIDIADSTVAGAGRDTILDFDRAQSDVINLQAIDARSDVGGNQAFSFIGYAAFSNVAGQLRGQVANGGTVLFGDINGDSIADFAIRVDGETALQAGDLVR